MKMEESATPFSRPDCLLLSLAIRILRSRRVDDLRFRIPDESALPIDSPLFFFASITFGRNHAGGKSVDFIASTFSHRRPSSSQRNVNLRTGHDKNRTVNWALEHVPELF
jgi:hypothetical protein